MRDSRQTEFRTVASLRGLVVLLLGMSLVACQPVSMPVGWASHSVARPGLSLAVPPDWRGEVAAVPISDTALGVLGFTAPGQRSPLVVVVVSEVPAIGWHAAVERALAMPGSLEPIELAGGEAAFAPLGTGEIYAFPPQRGAVGVLWFPDTADPQLSRMIADSVRLTPPTE